MKQITKEQIQHWIKIWKKQEKELIKKDAWIIKSMKDVKL